MERNMGMGSIGNIPGKTTSVFGRIELRKKKVKSIFVLSSDFLYFLVRFCNHCRVADLC